MEKNLKQLPKSGSSEIIKMALLGSESSRKAILATQLAQHFQTACLSEFAIDFCEINLISSKVISKENYNFSDSKLDYDLFFLVDMCDVTLKKEELKGIKQTLLDTNKPFIVLSGEKDLLLVKAISIVNDLDKAKVSGLSVQDFVQIFEHGIPIDNIQKQLDIFKNGIAKTVLVEPATLSNGILKLSENDFQDKAAFFDANKTSFKLEKFVPASGAASRMFKFLSKFLNDFDIEKETINGYINRKKDSELSIFIIGMNKFPFFEEVYLKLKAIFPDFDQLERDYKNYYFIQFMMSSDYFDFSNKPKGILPFHKYKTHIATAIEEHLYECGSYSSSNGTSNLHFTVSENHKILFENIIKIVNPKIEKQTNTSIFTNFSFQKKSSDTLAVDFQNKPFRDEKGRLFFRPGGHGALIENLNNLDADIVFIKNIDNVIQNQIERISLYKKALAGILMDLQQKIFHYLNEIDNGNEAYLNEIITFISNNLNLELTENFQKFTLENKISYLKNILDRPIRICGMVKNEGEPGGGPFWVRDPKGNLSLQIVETSQIDLDNVNQVRILSSATHFNPVDLVCGIRNYKNEKFDLTQFIDQNSGFIIEKTKGAKPLKSYELPGLWNGAMANWITIFVEVPLFTFNPVKTVNDLLKSPHQPQ